MAEDSAPDAPARKPFSAFLQEHRKGGLHGELSDALAELVSACCEHDKKGTLTIKIEVAPNSDGMSVTISDKIDLKAPEASRGASIWFVDDDGNVSRRNPMQPELPLRELREDREADTA